MVPQVETPLGLRAPGPGPSSVIGLRGTARRQGHYYQTEGQNAFTPGCQPFVPQESVSHRKFCSGYTRLAQPDENTLG